MLCFSEKYDKLKTPPTRAALRHCLQVQVVTLPARIADSSFLHGMKQSSGSGTFLEKLPGASKAKGGMSDESDGDSHALHGHFQFSGIDRGRDPSDR